MSRPIEVVGPGLGIDQRPNGGRAVTGRDPGRRPMAKVHRDGKGRSLGLGICHHHQGQVQLVGPLALEGHTEYSRGVLKEEGHTFGRDVLGGHDEVAFVLAILVIDHDDHPATAQLCQRLFDSSQGHQTSTSMRISPPTLRTSMRRPRFRTSIVGVETPFKAASVPAAPAKAGA